MAGKQSKPTGSLLAGSLASAANKQSYASNTSLKYSTLADNPNAIRYRKKSDLETLEEHGDEAITLIKNSNSIFGKVLDISRLIFSSLLLILSIFSIIYAITEHETLMPQTFPNWTLYIILLISLMGLGVLEGLQIAVVELAHKDPYQFTKYYPRAAKLLKYENKGSNVERFLIGRQVMVVLLVFVAARITTFEVFPVDIPRWIIQAFMFSGFLGVILVVIVAQLTPQVLAAAYPVEFLNLPGMSLAFSICLLVESSGIAHAVWLICWSIKNAFYSLLCKYHNLRASHYKKSMNDGGERELSKISSIVQDIETNMDDQQSLNEWSKSKKKKREKSKKMGLSGIDRANDMTMNNSKIVVHIEELMQQMEDRPDLFYLFGDDKYPGPSHYVNKFKDAGCTTPAFLLPPTDENHIPPHIVAMALLKKTADTHSKVEILEVSKD